MAPPTRPIPGWERPAGLDDATVAALGKLSEALECVEHARGHLYAFHRLSGHADLTLGDAIDAFRDAGHESIADRLAEDLQGRNVLQGRWTFQIVEEYDDGYYTAFREHERAARDELADGRRHLYEAEMKAGEIDPDRPGQDPVPDESTR